MQMILTIALVAACLLCALLLFLLHTRKQARAEIETLFRYLDSPPDHDPMSFTHELIQDVPEPARRYLVHALADSRLCPYRVKLLMDGSVSFGDGKKNLKTKSRYMITARLGYALRGFCPPRLHLHEYYHKDMGEKIWTSMLLWAVKKHQGDETSRSLREKFALHLIWLPSALLPQFGTIWRTIDENSAQAKLLVDQEPIDINLTIGTDGALRSARVTRWTSPEESFTYLMEVEKEESFEGIVIPSQVRIFWKDDSAHGIKNSVQLLVRDASFS